MSIESSLASKNSHKSSFSFIKYTVPTWYHNLPVEVLTNIFKYFSEEELSRNIIPVCKMWRYASMRPELWKNLYINGKDVPLHFICRRIKEFCYLESVCLDNITDPVAAIRQICRCIPNLKYLAIRNCSSIPETTLRNLIQCCKRLESLDLSGTMFKADRFYEEIAGLTQLRSVNLSKNSRLSVQNLMSVVLNCHKLEELRLSSFCPIKPSKQLSDEDVSLIISNLATELKSLTLDTSTLSNFSFQNIIMHCTKLEKLGLYGARNLSANTFMKIWEHLPQLRVMKIRYAQQISGDNICLLFVSGKHILKQLTSIDFSGCWKIVMSWLRLCLVLIFHLRLRQAPMGTLLYFLRLAEATSCIIKENPLKMADAELTDNGIEAIANCCENLESLGLKSCKSICSLQAIHDKCNNLKKLNIAFCYRLDLQTILPIQESITVLIIDRSANFIDIRQCLLHKTNLQIKICLSEYNREMENYVEI